MNTRTNTWILRGNRVVTPQGERPAAVIIRDGVIEDIVAPDRIPVSARIEDVGDRVVMPGLVDSHVHINEPGRTAWEGFESATQAAAAGGITTLADMPLNSSPVTTTVAALQAKQAAAQGKLWVDCGFLGGLVPGNESQLESLVAAGVLGIKAFMVHSGIDDFPAATEKELRAAMPVLARLGVPLLAHAELDAQPVRVSDDDPRSYRGYLASRPRAWENEAIDLLIRLCGEFKCRTHIVHLSSSDAIKAIVRARTAGLPLTVETCPHYLYFAAERIPDGDTRFKCAPPLREEENRVMLWSALMAGVIDFVVSDHSPCPPAMKLLPQGDFRKAWGGISSLQLGLPIVWTEAKKFGCSIENVTRWMCSGPAKFLGLEGRKGAIAPGHDADLIIWNPEVPFRVQRAGLYHRHKVTPYEGETLYGVIEKTYLRGRLVAEQGVVLAGATGRIIRKQPTGKQ